MSKEPILKLVSEIDQMRQYVTIFDTCVEEAIKNFFQKINSLEELHNGGKSNSDPIIKGILLAVEGFEKSILDVNEKVAEINNTHTNEN